MSFSIICLYTLNKNELVTNLLNVYHVIHLIVLDVMAPVERYWYRHLASTYYIIGIILSRVHVVMCFVVDNLFSRSRTYVHDQLYYIP